MENKLANNNSTEIYWDSIADSYNNVIHITVDDFHYGPLMPGDSQLTLLPTTLKDLRCLELGAGAAQNSIFLAKNGAECTALDISEKQLNFASRLMDENKVDMKLINSSMEDCPVDDLGKFDLIHSSYAMVFSTNPLKVFRNAYQMLKDDGIFLFSNGHPLFSGEWLELEDGDSGIFMRDYYNMDVDSRYDESGNEVVCSNYVSISKMFNWLIESGFIVEGIWEPQPIDIENLSPQEIISNVPYSSNGWCQLYEQMKHIPGVIIFKCKKR